MAPMAPSWAGVSGTNSHEGGEEARDGFGESNPESSEHYYMRSIGSYGNGSQVSAAANQHQAVHNNTQRRTIPVDLRISEWRTGAHPILSGGPRVTSINTNLSMVPGPIGNLNDRYAGYDHQGIGNTEDDTLSTPQNTEDDTPSTPQSTEDDTPSTGIDFPIRTVHSTVRTVHWGPTTYITDYISVDDSNTENDEQTSRRNALNEVVYFHTGPVVNSEDMDVNEQRDQGNSTNIVVARPHTRFTMTTSGSNMARNYNSLDAIPRSDVIHSMIEVLRYRRQNETDDAQNENRYLDERARRITSRGVYSLSLQLPDFVSIKIVSGNREVTMGDVVDALIAYVTEGHPLDSNDMSAWNVTYDEVIRLLRLLEDEFIWGLLNE
ncbi:hypothetical protein C0989_005001 [Termitomyces sp. Mn162]|nr:hypothetical protein C0989_005001 [Termitomyces sp. Mn162]